MKETMTPRQRLNAALNHEEPDRVPLDLGGFQTGIHRRAYAALIEYLGFNEEIQTLDPVQQLAVPSETVLERFHIDTRYICAKAPEGFNGMVRKNERNGRIWHDLKDEFGVVWSMPDDQMLYMDISHHPLADAAIDDLADYPFPKGNDPSRFIDLRKKAIDLRKNKPYALSTGIGGVIYETGWYMRGLEKWYMDTALNPEFCGALLDRILKFWKDYYTGFMAEVGDLLDVVMVGDDLAGQDGPLFSPTFYKSIVKPRQKELVRHIHSLTKAKIWYHTCGGCTVYIPELIDNGIDIINPVQISCHGMDPTELKQRFGRDIVFWGGGIDAQHILPNATPEVVRKEVHKNMEIFKPGGGYVFNNVHNIQFGVPPENIIAMYDQAYESSFYP
ncbi:MAG: hypothetical protein JW709_09815 [Sedimentisphaerales bacterium]|nr:hypothetical protein [Sedimentisphaerales bacterium]